MHSQDVATHQKTAWNKGKLVGQKAPLKIRDIWAIRIRLQLHGETRNLALFNLAVDSKLRGCDLVRLRVSDVCHGGTVASRAIVVQRKTKRPVQFEITDQTRARRLDRHGRPAGRGLPVPEPGPRVAVPIDATVRPPRTFLGQRDWLGRQRLRDPFAAPHQADPDLPANAEFARGPAAAGTHQDREHGAIPGNRDR